MYVPPVLSGDGYSTLLKAALSKGFQIYHDGCARSIRRPAYLSSMNYIVTPVMVN